MTDTAVGASVCASGSQVWSGKTGSFTRKAAMISQKTTPSGISVSAGASAVSTAMSKEPAPRPSTRKPASMRADPDIVKSTNFIAL